MINYTKEYMKNSIQTKSNILEDDEFLNLIRKAAERIITAYKSDKKVLVAGNGGSAADAQHIVTELVSGYEKKRAPLNAIALTTNTSILTAIGNDYGNDYVFSRQIQAYGCSEDIYIAISTSGNSTNIINSINEAKKIGLYVIGLTGQNDCEMDKICDIILKIPSTKTPIIQESHIMIGHIICGLVENGLA